MATSRRFLVLICCFSVVTSFFFLTRVYRGPLQQGFKFGGSVTQSNQSDILRNALSIDLQHYNDYPLEDADIGERGTRTEALRQWITALGGLDVYVQQEMLKEIDKALVSLYSFLVHSTREVPYFASMRQHVIPGSRGIVILVSKKFFRMAAHLIGNIRSALQSSLPIQVAYAGDEDLPKEYRDILTSLYPGISTFDILDHFDNDIIDITHGEHWGWSTKAFAVLASSFEKIILLDADAVFLQKPDVIFDFHSGFRTTGALFFRDRLIWDVDRRKWFHDLLGSRAPSKTLLSSKVFSDGAGHEIESGLVALDKGRLDTFMGILHTCWQNTRSVRERWTYKMTYGDKESWLFGQELTGAPYSVEGHYGAILGERQMKTYKSNESEAVCGSTIMHVDEKGELLWHNGGLLAEKDDEKDKFEAYDWWMGDDGEWSHEHSYHCMLYGEIRAVSSAAKAVLDRSIQWAKEFDERFKNLIDLKRFK